MDRALLIADVDDPHAGALRSKLAVDGFECFIWDTNRINNDLPLYVERDGSLFLSALDQEGEIRTIQGFTKRNPVILRRLPPPVQPKSPNLKAMEQSFTHFIQGVVLQLCAQSTMVSKFRSVFLCERKLFQLYAARQADLFIPDTIIGNNAAAARMLNKGGADICFKPLKAESWISANGRSAVMPTRRIEVSQLEDASVRRFPGIFQQAIRKEAEVRAVISQERIIATRFHLQDDFPNNAEIDWRLIEANKLVRTMVNLPDKVTDGARRLLNILDLDFGVFDFCVSDNCWYFLEVNPFGNFLGMHPEADIEGVDLIASCVKRRLECSAH